MASARQHATSAKKTIGRAYAISWNRVYWIQYRLSVWRARREGYALSAVLLVLAACNIYFLPRIQTALHAEVNDNLIEPLRALFINLGGPLIGAAAIVSSLVMFAMQINIERMPHGLFRRLSADAKLLGAFAMAFVLAIGIACLSMVVDKSRLALTLSVGLWAVLLILLLFLYAFRRALRLVNPMQQLGIVASDAQSELRAWARRAERAVPLLRSDAVLELETKLDSDPDIARTTFFSANPHWTVGAKRAVQYVVSFVRRYAEHGDYEVAGGALNVLLAINATYIKAKGRTFYATNAFIENPFSTDEFLNDTLEHLRQLTRLSVLRADEQQIEQTFRAVAGLAQIYLNIDYSSPHASKSHAQLAAGYLSEAVKSVIPSNMPDVLMEGVSLMGRTAQGFLVKGQPNEIVTIAEQIAMIGCTGVAKENYRPVTMRSMAQLASLTFGLLRTKNRNVRFAIGQVLEDVSLLVTFFLTVPDTPLSNSHSIYLGPYYSSTNQESLRAQLAALVNALADTQPDDKDAKAVIQNLSEWADKLQESEKKLLLAAIKVKSHFTFDVVHWIAGVTEILLAASNLPACDHHHRDKLRKQALRLISVLAWIPDDMDSVSFVENFQLTDLLFEAAEDARRRGCDDIAEGIAEMLLSWTFEAGKHRTGWGTLETGLRTAAVLALLRGDTAVAMLRVGLNTRLSGDAAPSQEIRDGAVRDLREEAESLHGREFPTSRVEAAINHLDRNLLRSLLKEIADLLSPGTANDPVSPRGMW